MNKAYFTFLQYATRKTGVGRTSWFFSIIIHIGAGAAIWYGQSMIRDGEPWGWVIAGIGAIMAVGFWLGTRSNYRTDKAREERGSSNFHYPDVCEGCDPVRFNDGRPLTPMYVWVAAIKNISREAADQLLDDLPDSDFHALRSEYSLYLDDRQFSKFQTK